MVAARTLWQDEAGQDLIEYSLVAALIALGAIVTLRSVSTKVNTIFTNIATALTSVA